MTVDNFEQRITPEMSVQKVLIVLRAIYYHRTTAVGRWLCCCGNNCTSAIWRRFCIAQWLRGRASDSRLRDPGFVFCAAVLKPWAGFLLYIYFTSSLSCINEYMALGSGGYVYEQPSCINYSIWLDASQRSQDGV